MKLVERWRLDEVDARVLRTQGERALALDEDGNAVLLTHRGAVNGELRGHALRHGSLAPKGAVFSAPSSLLFADDSGDIRWQIDLESPAVGRVFVGMRDDAIVFLRRRKRFLFERYALEDGRYLETRPLERRRGMVIGDRVWTRDALGMSSYSIYGHRVERCPIRGNGKMSARGDSLFTAAAGGLVHIRGGSRQWYAALEGRDLRSVAEADGLPIEDDEFAPARAGRATLMGELVLVPDPNGVLHALDASTGKLRWRFEGRHYPTLDAPPRPAVCDEKIIYLCADESLYLLDLDGTLLSECELPDIPDGGPERLGTGVLLSAGGLRYFELA